MKNIIRRSISSRYDLPDVAAEWVEESIKKIVRTEDGSVKVFEPTAIITIELYDQDDRPIDLTKENKQYEEQ